MVIMIKFIYGNIYGRLLAPRKLYVSSRRSFGNLLTLLTVSYSCITSMSKTLSFQASCFMVFINREFTVQIFLFKNLISIQASNEESKEIVNMFRNEWFQIMENIGTSQILILNATASIRISLSPWPVSLIGITGTRVG